MEVVQDGGAFMCMPGILHTMAIFKLYIALVISKIIDLVYGVDICRRKLLSRQHCAS